MAQLLSNECFLFFALKGSKLFIIIGLGRQTGKRREGLCTSTVNNTHRRNTGKEEFCANKNSYLLEITTDTKVKLVGDFIARYNRNRVTWTRQQTGKRKQRRRSAPFPATRIVQSLYFLNSKFQASRHLLWLYSLVCVGPGRKPRRPVFSQQGSINIGRDANLYIFIICKNHTHRMYDGVLNNLILFLDQYLT